MIERQLLPIEHIIPTLNTSYGLEIETLVPLLLGADINAAIYKAQAHDLSYYFVKLKTGHDHDIGFTLLELLHETGIQQIIPPIKTTLGQPTQPIGDFTLIVYPFVKGQDGFRRNLTDDQWFTLGKVLRQIHEFGIPSSVQRQIRQEDYSPKWREAVQLLYTRIEAEPNGDEMAVKLLMFIKEHRTTIQRLVDRADELGKKVQEQSPEFVLCHSDIHGGNVLIDEKGSIYIVDWDAPIMAPKERDLMFIGGGIANVWNQPHEEEFFYKGYGKTEINKTSMAYYRHERIVEDIAVYSEELLFKGIRGANGLEMYKQFIDMFVPQGVVDIAFKTDTKVS